MPDHTAPETVAESLASALEAMAFISPFPFEGEGTPPAPAKPVVASVRCHAQMDLVVEMMSDESLGAYIVSNVTGGEPAEGDPIAQADDALKELMNVMAGVLLRRIEATGNTPLALDVPAIDRAPAPGAWRRFTVDPATTVLDADGHTIAVRFRSAA